MSWGRFERPRSAPPFSEINVTPLVDVMLVLLVIFMLTAPLLTTGLQIELPRVAAAAAPAPAASLVLEIDPSGQAFLDGQPLDAAALERRLAEAGAARPEAELQLRIDQSVPYGRVAQIMGWAQQAGLGRIGFVAETQAPGRPGR